MLPQANQVTRTDIFVQALWARSGEGTGRGFKFPLKATLEIM